MYGTILTLLYAFFNIFLTGIFILTSHQIGLRLEILTFSNVEKSFPQTIFLVLYILKSITLSSTTQIFLVLSTIRHAHIMIKPLVLSLSQSDSAIGQ